MPGDATRHPAGRSWTQRVAWIAIAVAVVGVFTTWLTEGPVTVNGTQGPNNGWLVVIVAAPASLWARSLTRGSWVGIVGVVGSAVVMGWTAVENWRDGHDVLGASANYGLVLVLAASVALGVAGIAPGVALFRARHGPPRDAS